MKGGLRTQILIVFVIAVVFATAVTTLVGIHNTNKDLRETTAREQDEAARGIAASLRILSDNVDRTLASTASLISMDDLDPQLDEANVRPLLDSVVSESQAVDAVLLLDREGRPLMTRPPAHPLSEHNVSDHPGFRAARETGRTSHSFSTATGPPLWVHPLTTALERDEQHFLAASLNLNQVRQVLLHHGLEHTEVSLSGPNGPVVSTNDEFFATDPDTQAQIETTADLMQDTGDRFVSTATIAGSDASILISGSKDPLRTAQWDVAIRSVMLAASLTIVVILAGIWTAHRITRPLSHLEKTAWLMGKGHLHARAAPTGPPEIQSLAATLNQMANDLDRERQDLLDLQGQLESLVEERTGQLVERRHAMEQFFYGVSHDIKSPVVAITALSEMAQEDLQSGQYDKDDLGDLLARIEESSGQLKYFVDELLQFAQAESLTPVIQVVDIDQVARSAARELELPARSKKITLKVAGTACEVQTDPDELRQILVNLIQNAVKYMPKNHTNPRVTTAWSVVEERLEITVQDNGSGIPPHVKSFLFQPFTHGSQDHSESDGAGLGLSIVKRIADALGLTINLETPTEGGSRFRISFPRDALIRKLLPTENKTFVADPKKGQQEEVEMKPATPRRSIG